MISKIKKSSLKRTFTEDRIFSLKGKIIDGAYSKLSGRIEVTETETDLVQVGNSYRFTVNSNLRSEEIWKQMFLEERPYYCKKKSNMILHAKRF